MALLALPLQRAAAAIQRLVPFEIWRVSGSTASAGCRSVIQGEHYFLVVIFNAIEESLHAFV
jgi:hypothetical protein